MKCETKTWFLAAALLSLLTPAAARATPALTVDTTTTPSSTAASSVTVGWSFKTGMSSVSVVALDAILTSVPSTTVRLYGGLVSVSATVSSTDPTETAGLTWNSHTLLTPVMLAANTTYYIAQDYPSSNTAYSVTPTPTMTNGMIYNGGVDANSSGQSPTTNNNVASFTTALPGNGYFGPNFDVGASVPEPSVYVSAAVLGLGLAAHGAWRRLSRVS